MLSMRKKEKTIPQKKRVSLVSLRKLSQASRKHLRAPSKQKRD
jgi:hypothetical protein